MLARDIMTTDVITVTADTTVEQLAKILVEKKISGVPVIDQSNRIIGMVSEADLIVRDSKLHIPSYLNIFGSMIFLENPKILDEEVRKAAAVKVPELMSKEVISVTEGTSIEEIATIMVEKKVNRVPVVQDDQLVGIISRGDIVKSMVKK